MNEFLSIFEILGISEDLDYHQNEIDSLEELRMLEGENDE